VHQADVTTLLDVLDFCNIKTVLDPWAGNPAVAKAFQSPGSTLVTNDRWGKADLHLEPLETHLYETVSAKMNLDAIVMIPPVLLADIALVTAFYHVDCCVCMFVPTSWLTHAPASRLSIVMDHIHEDTFMGITTINNPSHCWVCFFKHPALRLSMIQPNVQNSTGWIIVQK
jgi:hypothetical protein